MDDHGNPDALKPRYKRVLLKLSGEGLGYPGKAGISIDETLSSARQAQRVRQPGVQLAIAAGGGNLLRADQVARELEADILLKATRNVDGIYSDDPVKNPHAVRYEKLTYAQMVRDNLRVMDIAAVDLCRQGKMPILVFNFKREGNIERAI